jgi:hypothetical protein
MTGAMPTFTRIAWTGLSSQAIWAPRLPEISTAIQKLRMACVENKLVDVALVKVASSDMASTSCELAEKGICSVVIDEALGAKGQTEFYALIARPETIPAVSAALVNGDLVELRTLMGIPECCQMSLKSADPAPSEAIWNYYARPETSDGRHREVELSAINNVLLARLGIQILPFIPCSVTCPAALELARRSLEEFHRITSAEVREWADSLLGMPIKWTALHSICEITSPIMRVICDSHYTREKISIHGLSTEFPEASSLGTEFPYRLHTKRRFTESRAYQGGLLQLRQSAGVT